MPVRKMIIDCDIDLSCARYFLPFAMIVAIPISAAAQAKSPIAPKETVSDQQIHELNLSASDKLEQEICGISAKKHIRTRSLANFSTAVRSLQEIKILAIGSSSTWGTGASSPAHSYPAQLEKLLRKRWPTTRWQLINRGIPGEKAAGAASRLRSLSKTIKPHLVLWQLGTNDATSRVPANQFRQTMQSTINFMRRERFDVILVGMQYSPQWARDSHYASIRDQIITFSERNGVPLVQRFKPMQQIAARRPIQAYLAKDQFHLNDLGYTCLAMRIAATISTAIPAPSPHSRNNR